MAGEVSEFEVSEFEIQLRVLINTNSRDRDSNTPDYILARYLVQSLEAFTEATKARQICSLGKLTDET